MAAKQLCMHGSIGFTCIIVSYSYGSHVLIPLAHSSRMEVVTPLFMRWNAKDWGKQTNRQMTQKAPMIRPLNHKGK